MLTHVFEIDAIRGALALLALGACADDGLSPSDDDTRAGDEVVRLVLGRGLRIVAAGTGLGLVAAYGGARVIERQLFGVPAADVTTFVSVPVVLAIVAQLRVGSRRGGPHGSTLRSRCRPSSA
jgi:hypothetical protein